MMKRDILYVMAFVIALGGAGFAAPLLEISEYETVPTTVYPGTLGYLQLTISNTGDSAADSVSAHYDFDGTGKTASAGSISAGSAAQISVPFKISQSAAGSIQLINADVYYTYDSQGSQQNRQLSLSIPLQVSQYKPLEVELKAGGKAAIAPGEGFALSLRVKNTGGVINNLVISMPENSTFSIDGATQKQAGSIAMNSSAAVELRLVSSSGTATGTYSIPVEFSYQDALRQPVVETLYLGPISVLDFSSQYRISVEPLAPVEIGSQVPVKITLENLGASPISATLDVNSTGIFTPIGAQRVYFDAVPAGGKAEKEIAIGVLSTASSGYYTLPLTLTPVGGKAASYNAGLAVAATPEITVSLDTSSAAPSVQIANTGNSQIRSVHAKATVTGTQVMAESFIGTLNVDDFATLTIGSTSARSVDVEIRYRDSNNEEHTLKETLEATSTNSTFVGQGTGRATGTAQNNAATGSVSGRSSNPLGFLLGPGSRSANGTASAGIDPLLIGVGVLVVAGVGYFAYLKFWKGRKQHPHEAAKR